jgi:nucleotide-binding universal stress UspA family protein
VLIAYDGSAAADHAVREAGGLLEGEPALVVVVWKQGVGFEVFETPTALSLPPAQIDIATAVEIDEAMQERAQGLAQQGAGLARDAGFKAEGLAVADDPERPVPETLLEVALKRDARAIVIAPHTKGAAASIILGSTTRSVVRHAPCPVLVVREMDG